VVRRGRGTGEGKRRKEPLPPPLPPETRTVGQVVAESVRFYRQNFWRTLPLGVSVAAITQLAIELSDVRASGRDGSSSSEVAVQSGGAFAFMVLAIPLLLTLSFVLASSLVTDTRLDVRRAATAYLAGLLVLVPVPFVSRLLGWLSVLPTVAWLALVGLAVPVAVHEGLGIRLSLRRAVQLARADYLHAFGSFAALAIVYFVTRLAMLMLLNRAGESTIRTAGLLADLVVSPILFVGGALVYVDQAARITSGRTRKRRDDAALPDALDSDRPGAADAPVES
jgi:hypothetical protein